MSANTGYLFIELSHDCGDEFDVSGCAVMLESDWDEVYAKIKQGFETFALSDHEYFFGTNQYLRFDEFSDFACGITLSPCSKSFYDEFNAITNGGSAGYWIIERLLERLEDVGEPEEGDEE